MQSLPRSRFDPERVKSSIKATSDDAQRLNVMGFCTIPVVDAVHLRKLRDAMDWTVMRFPEYNRNPEDKSKTSPLSFKDHVASHPIANKPDIEKFSAFVREKTKGKESVNAYRNKPIQYVQGGFAAFGNPASFHNDFVRQLRGMCYEKVIDLMREYEGLQSHEPRKFEMIVDRMMLRQKGVAPSAEAPHRDETPIRGTYKGYGREMMRTCNDPDTFARFKTVAENSGAEDGDDLFGGWLNLDDQSQFFNCIKGNFVKRKVFNPESKSSAGFSRLSIKKEDVQSVEVPPGHILVFFQNLAHEVRNKKAAYNMYRLFTAFRLTNDNDSLFHDFQGLMDNLESVPLKSLQIPPLYAKLHWVCFRHKIIPWSYSTIQKRFLMTVPEVGINLNKEAVEGVDGKTILLAPRVLKGLRFICTPAEIERICSPYTSKEKAMYFPHSLGINQAPSPKRAKRTQPMQPMQPKQRMQRAPNASVISSSQEITSSDNDCVIAPLPLGTEMADLGIKKRVMKSMKKNHWFDSFIIQMYVNALKDYTQPDTVLVNVYLSHIDKVEVDPRVTKAKTVIVPTFAKMDDPLKGHFFLLIGNRGETKNSFKWYIYDSFPVQDSYRQTDTVRTFAAAIGDKKPHISYERNVPLQDGPDCGPFTIFFIRSIMFPNCDNPRVYTTKEESRYGTAMRAHLAKEFKQGFIEKFV